MRLQNTSLVRSEVSIKIMYNPLSLVYTPRRPVHCEVTVTINNV